MTNAEARQPQQNSLADLVRGLNVEKVALIDDAFDKPNLADLEPQLIERFLNEIEASDDARAKLAEIAGAPVVTPDDVDDRIVLLLWEAIGTLGALEAPTKALFGETYDKILQVERICGCCERDLGLEVLRLGTMEPVEEKLADVPLVFIDYFLERSQSSTKSISIAKNIYEAYSGARMPLIILMSSSAEVEAHQDTFREASRLLKGMFYFEPKEALEKGEYLALKFGCWAKNRLTAVEIQKYVHSLETAIGEATADFLEGIKALQLDDYYHLHDLSLQAEGQPLGDYLNWIYGLFFSHCLFEKPHALARQRAVVDALDRMKPSGLSLPSESLERLYRNAVFEFEVSDVTGHAWDTDVPPSGPALRLGDVFTREQERFVLMVINADCDLVHAPGTGRTCAPEDRILLIGGNLIPLAEPPPAWTASPALVRTDCFLLGDQSFRVFWNTKRVESVEFANFFEWKKDSDYKRTARMRSPFALDVQRKFANQVSRLGLPVAPPLSYPIGVEFFVRDPNGNTRAVEQARYDLAFVVVTDEGPVCHLTAAFGHRLREVLVDSRERLEREGAELGKSGGSSQDIQRCKVRVEEIDALLPKYEAWFLALSPQKIPAIGTDPREQLKTNDARLGTKAVFLSHGIQEAVAYNAKGPVVVNLRDL